MIEDGAGRYGQLRITVASPVPLSVMVMANSIAEDL